MPETLLTDVFLYQRGKGAFRVYFSYSPHSLVLFFFFFSFFFIFLFFIIFFLLPSFLEQEAREPQASISEAEDEGGVARRRRRTRGLELLPLRGRACVGGGGRRRRRQSAATSDQSAASQMLFPSILEHRDTMKATSTTFTTLPSTREAQRGQGCPD